MKKFKHLVIATTLGLSTLSSTANAAAEVGPLEPVTTFEDARGAGITFTPSGRLLISMHPLDTPILRVVEVMADGTKQPFPNTDWADGPQTGEVGLSAVIGIHSDSQGVVWMLDMGSESAPAQLVAWNSVSDTLVKIIELGKDSLHENSFIQDFVIDEKHNKIYIADMTFGNFAGATKPAIIVVDIATGESKRVLENAPQFMPEDRELVIEASLLASKTKEGKPNPLKFGLNPIALDPDAGMLYFGAFTGTTVYQIPTSVISNTELPDSKLEESIQEFGPKNPSDGIALAPGGGILATDLENNAIGLTTKAQYQLLVQDKRLSWPDSLATSNGYVYVTQDQLHQHPAFSQGLGSAKPPYVLYRFRFKQ
ncbi:L-dopachrome tautomerase-related protein [Salinimonas lutimaris]|uniref:L-dopachrome tautomerase-related protein n=1 Tax=Salinimonas lutimaris TaxID=914153 RepID=UPI0010BFD499|nr:L-dopachrome tautomerase-related protein [Salinimonas lutimaris]